MSGARILVVDDNPANLKLVSFLLRGAGYAVSTACDADEAMAAVAEETPDLIVMDIQLPGMDGLALTHHLRAEPRTSTAIIVAVSAYAMAGDQQRALDAGCDGYISKPIDTRTFVAQIAAFVVDASRRPGQEDL